MSIETEYLRFLTLTGGNEIAAAVLTLASAQSCDAEVGNPQRHIADSRNDQVVELPESTEDRGTLTPPAIARRLKVSPDKVLKWIRSNSLKASNLNQPGKRPRRRQ